MLQEQINLKWKEISSGQTVMMLQELIEKGFVTKIETDSTSVGNGYKIYVKLLNYSIGSVVINVGIDETLDDAIILINKMVEVDVEIKNSKSQNI